METNPLPLGAIVYGDARIVEVIDHDPADEYQPYLYLLDHGETVWIPVEDAITTDH